MKTSVGEELTTLFPWVLEEVSDDVLDATKVSSELRTVVEVSGELEDEVELFVLKQDESIDGHQDLRSMMPKMVDDACSAIWVEVPDDLLDVIWPLRHAVVPKWRRFSRRFRDGGVEIGDVVFVMLDALDVGMPTDDVGMSNMKIR